jgi:hypothetical protein
MNQYSVKLQETRREKDGENLDGLRLEEIHDMVIAVHNLP